MSGIKMGLGIHRVEYTYEVRDIWGEIQKRSEIHTDWYIYGLRYTRSAIYTEWDTHTE